MLSRRRFLRLSTALGAVSTVPFVPQSALGASTAPVDQWQPRALQRRPNIVMVVLDDVGFADFSCYGSEGLTPGIDKLAANGVRFNNFHVTALCAPTRACLLTGRNAHAVGVGNIAEWGRPNHPGYRGWIREDAATLAEMLREEDYATFALGKWHLSMIEDQNASGPFEHWPIGRGFDHWFGCHGNAIDHFHPELFENTTQVNPDKANGFHLSEALVDRAGDYIHDHLAAAPDRPFFTYLAFGACHFPFHPPAEAMAAHRGRYDEGWDVLRAQRFQHQQELGIIPDGTQLSPRGPTVTPWNDVDEKTRAVGATMQEAYAGFLSHTDAQVERLVEMLRGADVLDNTIFVVMSDNGAAAGGAPQHGMFDVRRVSYQEPESIDWMYEHRELIGTEDSQCMYGPGWAQAGNAPLKWFKADTYGGGTRSPLVMHWPDGKIGDGGIRPQYCHAIDVVPTILEMINAKAPDVVDGIEQMPIQGTSFAYALDHADAEDQKPVQYYETAGDRAIWSDGWKAVVRHHGGGNFEDDVWELYHTDVDFSETRNLAEQHTERLMMLVAMWDREAERHNILPMANNLLELYQQCVPEPRATHRFRPGMTRIDRLSAPDIFNFDAHFEAEVSIDDEANGVLIASGDGGAGYEWFIKDGVVHFHYAYTREQRYEVTSAAPIPRGTKSLGLRINHDHPQGHHAELFADSESIGKGELPKMWPIYAPNAGLRCGANDGAPISHAYAGAFTFDQPLQEILVEVATRTGAD
ncbi:MAG: arylsulfatase [Pseudomonadota bacterium]